ncbi:hypothetical protein [Polluticaenibacter yanchengensis]|uniref:Uncharacterized protein n=1 Tax=Polluticaenibacter yanchengensis TaxID=3014562 RepID=A0ABT4UJ59_9BACT|nr:hypothetical protein [Chitinophagaceae bacterium LY-5]
MKKKINIVIAIACFCIAFIGVSIQATAQSTTNKQVGVPKKKITFISKWGPYTGNTKATIDDIKKLVSLPVTVIDSATKEKWEILKFNFGWRKKDIFDDIDKGTRKVIFIPNVVTVTGDNKVPVSWQKEILEFVTTGEQFIIEGIIIQNPKTKEARMCKPILITVL